MTMTIDEAIEQLMKMRNSYNGKREVFLYVGEAEGKEMLFAINEFRVIPKLYNAKNIQDNYSIGFTEITDIK
jgi:hypothetical protein